MDVEVEEEEIQRRARACSEPPCPGVEGNFGRLRAVRVVFTVPHQQRGASAQVGH